MTNEEKEKGKKKELRKYDVKLEPLKTGKAWNHGFTGFKTEAQILLD